MIEVDHTVFMGILEHSLVPFCAHILLMAYTPCKKIRKLQSGGDPNIGFSGRSDFGEIRKFPQHFRVNYAITNMATERFTLIKMEVDVLHA